MSVLGAGALAGCAARETAGKLSATAASTAPRRRVGEIMDASSGGLVGARMGQRAGRSPMPKTTAGMRGGHGGGVKIPSSKRKGNRPASEPLRLQLLDQRHRRRRVAHLGA